MQIVPVQPIPNQTLQIQLGGQPCTLNLYQTMFGLFMAINMAYAGHIYRDAT